MTTAPARWRVILAYAAVYVIWGTTYLGIRFAIETVPPFLMGGTRFLAAGALLYGWTSLRGTAPPPRRSWGTALLSGAFLIAVAQGAVSWAEQYVNSGLAAVLAGTMPIWLLTFNWARPRGQRPNAVMITGVALGFAGVLILLAPWQTVDRDVDLIGAAAVLLGVMSWTGGSLYTRTIRISPSHFQTTAMQMLCGGALLTLVGTVTGDWTRVSPGDVSLLSALALAYLVVVGSIVALTAYTWLLGVSAPSRVSTYAYVNPVVAVFLGWLLAGETLTPRMALGVVVIVSAVVLVTMGRVTDRTHGSPTAEAAPAADPSAPPEPTGAPVPTGAPALPATPATPLSTAPVLTALVPTASAPAADAPISASGRSPAAIGGTRAPGDASRSDGAGWPRDGGRA